MKKILSVMLLAAMIVFCCNNSAMAYSKLTMVNQTGRTISYVYFVPKHYKNWGDDRLSGVWHNGNTFTLSTEGWKYWSIKICFTKNDYYYWDGDNAINTDSLYKITFINNGQGGYKYIIN